MRRSRWKRIAVGGLAALTVLGGYAFFIEPNRLVVRRHDLDLPGLPPLTIAAISDLHAGTPFIDEKKLERVVELTNAEHPDVIVLLGDFTTTAFYAHDFPPEKFAPILGRLRAREGVFAVLGNHDAWTYPTRVKTALEAAGIQVLDDKSVRLAEDPVWIVGLSDFMTGHPHPDRALRKIPPDGAGIIAITHNPDLFPKIPPRVNLTIAGHTHGGQVRLPLIGRPSVPSRYGQRYAAGYVEELDKHLFVTTGIGTSNIPVRLGVVPEIAVLRINQRR